MAGYADADLSRERLFAGRLTCMQSRAGYRFTQDAVLLAHFVTPGPGARILDLGTGCGIIALILAYRWPQTILTGLEIQPGLAALARRNIEENGLADRICVKEGDLRRPRALFSPQGFDWVVANPPYRPAGGGRQNPQPEQAAARHEILADLEAVLGAARYALRPQGRLALVYPADRLVTLLHLMREADLEPKRLQMVHAHLDTPANLALVEGRVGGGQELEILPPLVVYQADRVTYSPAMAACYAP